MAGLEGRLKMMTLMMYWKDLLVFSYSWATYLASKRILLSKLQITVFHFSITIGYLMK